MKDTTECLTAPSAPTLEGPGAGPTIFTKVPGRYITRDGHEVEIYELREGDYFPIKGRVRYVDRRSVLYHRRYDIWTEDGRLMPTGMSPLDIVGVWQP